MVVIRRALRRVSSVEDEGVAPITVSELMGHSDATMVSRVYQHLGKRLDHMEAAALKALGRSGSLPSPIPAGNEANWIGA